MKFLKFILPLLLFFYSSPVFPVFAAQPPVNTYPVRQNLANQYPVKQAIDLIAAKYHVNFMYQDGLLSDKTTSFKLDKTTKQQLEEVLNQLLFATDLSFYHAEKSNYIIYAKKKSSDPSAIAAAVAGSENRTELRDSLKTGSLSGYIYDQAGKPLEYSSVQLLNAKDSSLVKGSLSDSTGKFIIRNVTYGTYITRGIQMGYNTAYSAAFNLQSTMLSLPSIVLSASSKQLNEVRVVAKRPMIERRIDRTVLNVESSVLASGGSINDILEIAPGVSIDNNQITMKGKQGVIVMIDDKPIKLSASQITALLQSMPANSIDKIELITNPSAKYDAQGKGGIINIKTKKGSNLGFNGTVTSGLVVGKRVRFNESATLNYKMQNLNLFGNYSYQQNLSEGEYTSDKLITGSENLKYNQNMLSHAKAKNNNARLGADYTINDKNTVGVLGTLNTSRANSDFLQRINFDNFSTNKRDSALTSLNSGKASFDTYSVNVNSTHILGEDDHKLQFNADYLSFRSANPNTYLNSYFDANGAEKRNPENVLNRSAVNINLVTAKLDYSYPIDQNNKFEAGAKTAHTHSNSDILFQKQDLSGTLITDNNRTNVFDYTENINAGYLNYISKLGKKTDLQLGFRAEHTSYKGKSVTTGEDINRSYLQLFPSLFVLHNFGKDQLSFSYSRRIDRPDFEDLNPFIDYSSPYFYTQGNPSLKPETTHSFEVNYQYHTDLNISLGYSITKDYFNYFTSLADSVGATKQTIANFKNYNTLALSLSYTKGLLAFWNLTANGDMFYDQYKTPVEDIFINVKQLGYSLNLLNAFQMNQKLSLELLGLFKSKQTVLTRHIDAKYCIDAGAKYSVLQNKGTIKFGVTDIFYTYLNKGFNQLNGLYSTFNNRNENRRFNLSFTYKFGSKPSAPKKDQSNKEELNRIK